jgi:hypothetical protein
MDQYMEGGEGEGRGKYKMGNPAEKREKQKGVPKYNLDAKSCCAFYQSLFGTPARTLSVLFNTRIIVRASLSSISRL